MKKGMCLALLSFCSLAQSVCMAAVWIDDTKAIISDSAGPYEIYLGYAAYADSVPSVLSLPQAGSDASVTLAESSRYNAWLRIQSGSLPQPGRQFQLSPAQSGLYVLYNSAGQVLGTYSDMLDPSVMVHINGTCQIGPGQTTALDGYRFNNPGYTQWVTGADYSQRCYDGWSVNDISVPQILTYEYLTGSMGLTAGTYELRLDAKWNCCDDIVLDAYALTTLTIVPEPATLAMFGLGGMLIKKRRG